MRRRDRGGDRGAVAVEFALIFPLLFFLLLGTLIFGWRTWERQAGQATAREAARLAALGSGPAASFKRSVLCLGERNGLRPGTLTKIEVGFHSDATLSSPVSVVTGPGPYVSVRLTYRSALGAMALITTTDGTFTAAGTSRVEQVLAGTDLGTPQTVTVNGERCT